MSNDASGIDFNSGGGVCYHGPDGVAVVRAFTIASALKLYAKTGIKANRAYTPKAMMYTATAITGKTFKPRDYLGAAAALTTWAQTMKSALPKTLDGKVVP